MMFALLLLVACIQPRDGTSVGNPGKTTLSLGEPDGLVLTRASMLLDRLIFFPCDDGELETRVFDAEVLLDGSFSTEVPAGRWCAVDVEISDGPWLEGNDPLRGSFEVLLAGVNLGLDSEGFSVDGDDWLLELGGPGWLEAEDLNYLDGSATLDSASPQYDRVLSRFVEQSAWWPDDGDGVLTIAEREAGPVTGPSEPDADSQPDGGGGCVHGVAPAGWWWVTLVPLLAWRVRRSAAVAQS